MPRRPIEMLDDALAGERLALARLLTLVENDTPRGRAALDYLYPHTGNAHIIGVTGSPGTGKSSLVNQLARAFRRAGVANVGVIAVDPSSPFTGGALLGDRVRMRDLSGDRGIFIRSMASRGAVGGLARSTASVVQVLDAAGFGVILIETVGAGQSEIEIASLAQTVLVVEAPELGDEIQAIKAGILEIADILIVNKCDLAGADRTARVLKTMMEMAHPTRPRVIDGAGPWSTPVLLACSTEAQGVEEIVEAIGRHRDYLKRSGEWEHREQERLQKDFDALLGDQLLQRFFRQLPPGDYENMLARLSRREISPFVAIKELMGER